MWFSQNWIICYLRFFLFTILNDIFYQYCNVIYMIITILLFCFRLLKIDVHIQITYLILVNFLLIPQGNTQLQKKIFGFHQIILNIVSILVLKIVLEKFLWLHSILVWILYSNLKSIGFYLITQVNTRIKYKPQV